MNGSYPVRILVQGTDDYDTILEVSGEIDQEDPTLTASTVEMVSTAYLDSVPVPWDRDYE